MSVPARTTLTAAIKAQLETIVTEQGARTNIGRLVHVGVHKINSATEAPCMVLTPGQEVPGTDAGPNGHVAITYTVSGFVNRRDHVAPEYVADPNADFALIDAVIADIRDAIEGSACDLSASAGTILYQGGKPQFSEDGGETCGAELRYLITTPYVDYIPGQ